MFFIAFVIVIVYNDLPQGTLPICLKRLTLLFPEVVHSRKYLQDSYIYFLSSVQSLSCVLLFVTQWTTAHQASLSITNSRSLLKLMSIKLVMPPNHLILCCLLLILLSIFPRIRVFSSESVLHIRWQKYWSFSFSLSFPMNIQG